jgi:predicted RecA/RadA family phage recombinase
MKNYIQPGDTITFTAAADTKSGDGVLVGSLFGIAAADYKSGDAKAQMKTTGVFNLPKTSAQAWTQGAKVYWDATNKVATTTVGSNSLIGVAIATAANPSAAGVVRLNGVSI